MLKKFIVFLDEQPYLLDGKSHKYETIFECMAEDEEHAKEQALDFYEDAEITYITENEMNFDSYYDPPETTW